MNPHRGLPHIRLSNGSFGARSACAVLLTCGLGLGCRTVAPEGTSVGNPGKGVLRIGRGDDVRIRSAELPVEGVQVLDCGGGAWALGGETALDLVAGLHFGLPTKNICALAVSPLGPLRVEGEALDGKANFVLTMPLSDFQLVESLVRADRQVFRLGEPGWLSSELLGIRGPGTVEIGPGDPRYSQIRAALLANVEPGTEHQESVPREEEGQFICNDEEGEEREWDGRDETEGEEDGRDCEESPDWEDRWIEGEGEEEAEETGEPEPGDGEEE